MNYVTVTCAAVLIRCVALVFCAPENEYKLSRFSDGTFACSLGQPSSQVPLQQQLSSGCVPARVRCAWMCAQDSRCKNFNLREDRPMDRCDLFYDSSTTCAVIPGCFHVQVDNEVDCTATECAAGFVYQPAVSKCYRLMFESLNQSAADRRCHGLFPDAHLAVIADATQQAAVSSFLDSMFNGMSNASACDAFGDGNTIWTSGVANPNASDTYLWNPAADVYYPVNYANFYYGQQQQQQQRSRGTSEGPVCISLLQKHASQWNVGSCAQQVCGLCEHEPQSMNEDVLKVQQEDQQRMDMQQADQAIYSE